MVLRIFYVSFLRLPKVTLSIHELFFDELDNFFALIFLPLTNCQNIGFLSVNLLAMII